MADVPTSSIVVDGYPTARVDLETAEDPAQTKSVGVTVGEGGGATVVRVKPLLVRSEP